MKLSQIKGADAVDVLARIIQPIANIALDKSTMQALQLSVANRADLDDDALRELAVNRLKSAIPALLIAHRDDVIEIIAAINQQDVDEYTDGLTFAKLLADVMDVLTDQELMSFFS